MEPIDQRMLCADNFAFKMEGNGNLSPHLDHVTKSRSNSVIDLSDSFKELNMNEYELDDDSFSAPFEILAEFLSSLMSRDYKNALHYCELILQYEPENITVQEFYPLIEHKIRIAESESSSEDLSERSESYCDRDSEESKYYSSASNEDIDDDCEATSNADLSNSESDIEEEG